MGSNSVILQARDQWASQESQWEVGEAVWCPCPAPTPTSVSTIDYPPPPQLWQKMRAYFLDSETESPPKRDGEIYLPGGDHTCLPLLNFHQASGQFRPCSEEMFVLLWGL